MDILVTSIQNIKARDQDTMDILVKGLNLHAPTDLTTVLESLKTHLDQLRPELQIVIETEYVDRVYRDSYYTYYSTKLEQYNRNCVRLSLFENTMTLDDDLDVDFAKKLQDSYLGFIILRPIVDASIGRNVISPKANKNFESLAVCETMVKASCMGYKLHVQGFPHSSQDGEMMTCAETTVWAMMEYFGNKYSIYTTTLPSIIAGIKDSLSYERDIPSPGMYYDQISKVLKQHGLSCIVYDNENPRFQELFSCYIESGFPLAVCLLDNDDTIGHAIVCVGRKIIPRHEIVNVAPTLVNNIELKSWNKTIKEFVFNDDNVPSYQIAKFDEPVKHYEDDEWNGVKITHFIVPLHKKIYIDAETAIDAANNLLVEVIGIEPGSVVRTFLTSSRSYKDYISKNSDFLQEEKQKLLTLDMAKFIWVTEYSDVDSFCREKANGIILMDATGHIDSKNTASIILYQKGKSAFVYNHNTRKHHEHKDLMSTCFETFKNNLKNI